VADRWQCPMCTNAVTLFIAVKHPPRCHRHSRRVVKMVLLEEANRG
jgi:hypothetical protein